MAQISKKLRNWAHEDQAGLLFYCPGCDRAHTIRTVGPSVWGWNGDVNKPTFTPSVLVSGRDFTPAGQAEYDAWFAAGCAPLNGKQFDSAPTVCHSFVTDGMIAFLGDCTHRLVGQTVELADWPERPTYAPD
jgi:hypothetical protein